MLDLEAMVIYSTPVIEKQVMTLRKYYKKVLSVAAKINKKVDSHRAFIIAVDFDYEVSNKHINSRDKYFIKTRLENI